MPTTDIPGYVPRLEAVDEYGRSEQSFRRDFLDAQKKNDAAFLQQVKVRLNDGTLIEGTDISRGVVDQFNSEGKQPVWFMSRDLLESRYWKKGKPSKSDSSKARPRETGAGFDEPHVTNKESTSRTLPDDVAFLKEHILKLERAMQQEISRNQKREEELFAQLKVKDKQISAWDEITQGLTRGLATGQIAPQIGEGTHEGKRPEPQRDPKVVDADVQEPVGTSVPQKERKKTVRSKKRRATKHSKQKTASTAQRKTPAKKQGTKKTTTRKKPEPAKPKPKGLFSTWFS